MAQLFGACTYIKKRLCISGVSGKLASDQEEHTIIVGSSNRKGSHSSLVTTSLGRQNLDQAHECSYRPSQILGHGSSNNERMIEKDKDKINISSIDLLTSMNKTSMEGVFQHLENIKHTNAKTNKELKAIFEIFRNETRGRLAKLEKKTSSEMLKLD